MGIIAPVVFYATAQFACELIQFLNYMLQLNENHTIVLKTGKCHPHESNRPGGVKNHMNQSKI